MQIFWALDPYDMPEQLKDNIEETVNDDGGSEATCAIIRLETLPALDNEEMRESGSPVGCFVVHMGTHPANVEFIVSHIHCTMPCWTSPVSFSLASRVSWLTFLISKRRINIYPERRPETPPHMKELIDMNGMPVSRLRRLSVNLGWTDPTAFQTRTKVPRHSIAVPSTGKENDSPRRRMTLQAGWAIGSRRMSSVHDTKPSRASLQQLQKEPQFGWRMSQPRPRRPSMMPYFRDRWDSHAENKAFGLPTSPTVHEDEVAPESCSSALPSPITPTVVEVDEPPPSPPIVHEIEVCSTNPSTALPTPTSPGAYETDITPVSSAKQSLEARLSGDAKTRLRKSKTPTSIARGPNVQPIEIHPAPAGEIGPASPTSPLDPVKREIEMEAALQALEGKAAPVPATHDDIPQYLLDAHREMDHTSSLSAARMDIAMSMLKRLSLSAVGHGSPDVRPDASEEADTYDEPAMPARSLQQRFDSVSRKLRTLSMGLDTPPVQENEPLPDIPQHEIELLDEDEQVDPLSVVRQPLAVAVTSEVEPVASISSYPSSSSPATSPIVKEASKRRTILFSVPWNKPSADREDSSASAPKVSKLRKGSRQSYVPVNSAFTAPSPPKAQNPAVSRVREETGEVKRSSRLKRFSFHVRRLFS